EFLPVSSSGHLAVTRSLTVMPMSEETFVFVAVTLHVATLCSVLVVYGRRLWQIVVGTVRGNAVDRRYAVLLIIGTVPGALLGALFHERFEQAFGSLRFIGVAFIITGLILWSTRWAKVRPDPLTVGGALQIGLAQAVAIFPGVSRSGSTVTAALWRGLPPVEAAEFSFLLAVIIIAGSGVSRLATQSLTSHRSAPSRWLQALWLRSRVVFGPSGFSWRCCGAAVSTPSRRIALRSVCSRSPTRCGTARNRRHTRGGPGAALGRAAVRC